MDGIDIKGKSVQAFKLTDGQKKFQRHFQGIQKVRKLLQLKSLALKQQVDQTTLMWNKLNEIAGQLQPPTEMTRDIEGMNFASPKEDPYESMLLGGQEEQGSQQGQGPSF